jgi:hypothetical protein
MVAAPEETAVDVFTGEGMRLDVPDFNSVTIRSSPLLSCPSMVCSIQRLRAKLGLVAALPTPSRQIPAKPA